MFKKIHLRCKILCIVIIMYSLWFFFSVLAGMKIEKVYTPITEFEEIDITKALTTNGRLYYPKIGKKTRIDDFLARRTHLKILEERRLLQSVSEHRFLTCFFILSSYLV